MLDEVLERLDSILLSFRFGLCEVLLNYLCLGRDIRESCRHGLSHELEHVGDLKQEVGPYFNVDGIGAFRNNFDLSEPAINIKGFSRGCGAFSVLYHLLISYLLHGVLGFWGPKTPKPH